MSKFSVKKPYTILVMVVMILILGGVSLFKMQLNLLPEVSLPYLLVITTYPGASPEQVEAEVCKPMESSLGTITGVKNIFSVSNENYGLIEMEFQDGTDLDSTMVKVSSAINTLESSLPDECGTPSIMEISMDMMATQYLAVSYEGMDIEKLSDFAEDIVVPALERQDGVASVSTRGLIEKTIQIELNKDKVDILNDKILSKTDDAFAKAVEQLDDAKKQLEDSQVTIDKNKQKLRESEQELEESKQELADSQTELDENKKKIDDGYAEIYSNKASLEEGKRDLANAQSETKSKLAKTETELLTAKSDLEATKMHCTFEIQTLQATNTAYNQAIGQLETAMYSCDAIIGALNTGLETFRQSGIPGSEEITGDTASLDLILEFFNPILIQMGQQTLDVATMNMLIQGCGKDNLEPLTGDSTVNTAIAELSTAKVGYTEQIEPLKQSVTMNEAMIAQYQVALGEVESNLIQVNEGLTQLYAGNLEAAIQFANAQTQISLGELQISSAENTLDSSKTQLESAQKQIDNGWNSIEDAEEQLKEGWESIADGEEQLKDGWEDYENAVKSYEKQKTEALKKANANELLSLETLAGLLYAQNFAMPAGYVDDRLDNSWLIKIGDNYQDVNELKNLVLCHIDDIGDIRLGDVADITVIDNSDESYARLGKEQAIILSIFKASTAGTNDVSKVCKAKIAELEQEYPDLDILIMVDQGDYINIIVKSVLISMVIGAALAILILAFFLKNVKPTLVVAISIPLSVLAALILMYFTGISLNMMSLSGLALGIGMLVDNSIVVIENIYRLRSKGVEAPRAAVQGTKQVAGAIVASTLTTVCVFLPMVYTSGMVNELLMPMCMSIIYCLMASLVIAMTVVPAAGSTLLRHTKDREHPWFDKIQDLYGVILSFCLKVKIVPLAIAIALLALTIWQVIRMGIVMIPKMTSNQIQMEMTLSDELNRAECYETADQVVEELLTVEGIKSVGVMDGNSSAIVISAGESNFRQYSYMAVLENEEAGATEINNIISDMKARMDNFDVEYSVSAGMADMSALLGSGLSINIYGDDLYTIKEISQDVMGMVEQIEGYTDISNGEEDAGQVLHLKIDKNKAMSLGLSVAQIYQELATKLTLSADALTVNIDEMDMNVVIRDEMEPLTKENLLNYTFTISVTDEDGDSVTEDHKLKEFAEIEIQDGFTSVDRKNQNRYMTVSATVKDGYNNTLLTRQLQPLVEAYEAPDGYVIEIGGEYDTVVNMIEQMALVAILGAAFIYLVMVAQFQSLLSPFIVLFTIPLAFTGGLMALWFTGNNLSIISLMGFLVLMGTVVNNGIVFVDYTNQLRLGGLDRHSALIATGKTRMRPILMTALTTILAESNLIFGDDMGSQMGRGMALVIAGGLAYATLMTLFIIPVMYDLMFKKAPLLVDIGSEDLDDISDDAADYMAEISGRNEEYDSATADVTVDNAESEDAESDDADNETADSNKAESDDADNEDADSNNAESDDADSDNTENNDVE